MEKLILENGEDKELIAMDMDIRIRVKEKDIEDKDPKNQYLDTNIVYLLSRLSTYFANHGFYTDNFKTKGRIEIEGFGVAEYELVPVAKEMNSNE
ncbi:hypothetical protein [Halanaerobium salsuginis]|jgi:hypothetical protein|uniref:Uncharacterized protein n=1 Tax=Halanaerobium salsuginis TaxID=29563 RepID=A0A1I4EW89_9FIRM|nr:hypothetical protein [Halanaerobium salsuginis]SFL09972.1 hypothetical protein SAMN02983006_00183 [Halanaerobium salsuginis]